MATAKDSMGRDTGVELVRVEDVYGRYHHVREDDLADETKTMLRLYSSRGRRFDHKRDKIVMLHRDTLMAETEENPTFEPASTGNILGAIQLGRTEYVVEEGPSDETPYILHGPRGGLYGLMRQREGDRSLMFVLNMRSKFLTSTQIKGVDWFTDRSGELKPAKVF